MSGTTHPWPWAISSQAPSHTLPTGGAGKSFPGLMADMFQRRTSIVRLTKESCAKSEPIVRAFAAVEGLDAHGESVAIRQRADV